MQNKETNAQAETERCVLCGKQTEFKTDAPIKDRIGYVEGIGQLCQDCHVQVYLKGQEYYDEIII